MRRREFSLLLGGALSVMPFIAAGTSKEASLQAPVNLLKVFPYIVPESWVRAPGLAALIWRKLAPDIYVVLVQELDGMVASVSPSQREQTGKTIGELFKIADANFVRAWGEQRFNSGFGVGNDGVKFGGAEGSWLAPSVVLSKFFLEQATARLGTRDVLIAIPNQERILAFPNALSSANSLRLATMVRDGFANHPKPVSARVFRWRGPGRLEPIAFRWLV